MLAKALHAELVHRAHFLTSDEIHNMSGIFQKLQQFGVVKPLARLDKQIRDRIKETDPAFLMQQMMFGGIPREEFNPDDIMVQYDRR